MNKLYDGFLDLVVYQIYPRSFCDSNGDGIGDLKGITSKLEYIRDLGANAIWICPIYKSPQCDNGYDISDYLNIEPDYGTMADFEELVEKAHGLNIKIIMDLVANHTSNEHEWFKKARQSVNNKYHNYYYWSKTVPNDWESVFGGSAWEYNEQTDEYYLHSFAVGQPDVNWTNEKVREEYCNIVDFWVDKGVDGFRCDVLDYVSKDFDADKMNNGPELHQYIKQLFGRDKVKNIFTVGECCANEKSILDLCGENRGELKCSFQFEHIGIGRIGRFIKTQPPYLPSVAKVLNKWQNFSIEKDFLYTLFTDNHDQPWYNSRLGNDKELRFESATMLATMFYGLKGIPFIYQGQEVGFASSKYSSFNAIKDVETENYYLENKDLPKEQLEDNINFGSRDNPRRPFAWTKDNNFGFSSSDNPWLEYSDRSREINVESDLKSDKSVIGFYKKLLKLRKEYNAFRRGSFTQILSDEKCFVYKREDGDNAFIVVCCYGERNEITGLKFTGKCVLSNYALTDEINRKYKPYETAIYKIK